MVFWAVILLALTPSTVPRPTPIVGAAQWTKRGIPGGDVTSLAAVPGIPTRLYAGTVRGSIYSSEDAGRTWTFLARPLQPERAVLELRVDPSAPATLYALVGLDLIPSPEGFPILSSLIRSDDEGKTWESLPNASAIAIDPLHPGTIYRGVPVGPIFKSTDGGRNWAEASPWFSTTKSMIVDTSNPDVISVVFASVVYTTTNGGENWNRVGPTVPVDFRLHMAGREGQGSLLATSGGNVFRSLDGGQTWASFPVADATTVFQLTGAAVPGGALFAATDRGLFRSDDLGQTWAGGDSFFGYPVRAVAALEPALLFAGTFQGGDGFFRSEDGGAHWTVSNGGLLEVAVAAIATDPHNPARLYAGGPGIFRSEDFGVTWQTLDQQLRPRLLAVDPSDSSRVYAVADGLVWRSFDAGLTFDQSAGSPQQVTSLAVDGAGVLYAGGSEGVFRSIDRGGSWSPASSGLGAPWFVAVVADPLIPGALFATTPANSGFSSAVFKTIDGASSWTGPILTTHLFEGVDAITVSSTAPRSVYAIFTFSERQITAGSVSVSQDGGSSWKGLFGSDAVYAIVSDPVLPSTLYVAASGGVAKVASTTTILGRSGFSARSLAVAPDGSTLYALDASQELSSLDLLLAEPPRTPRVVPIR